MTLLLNLLLAAVYSATGWIGLTWAMEAGFATHVWPPSGIALAAVLHFGYRVTPGVLLGSFAANLLSDNSLAGDLAPATGAIGAAAGVALGAALQAAGSCWLIRRLVGYPDPLVAPRRIIQFVTLGGPVGCLINAIVGPTTLLLGGAITADAWLETGITWWSGDMLGVLIFTPMLVIWSVGPTMRSASVTAAFLVTFVSSIAAYAHVRDLDRTRMLIDLRHRADGIPGALDLALQNHLSVLGSLEGARRAVDDVTPKQFREITHTALAEYNGLHAVSWNRRFANSERASIEQWLDQHYAADTHITERTPTAGMTAAATRSEYVAVLMIEPHAANRPALGFDVLSHPVRRLALDEARDTGLPVATGRITLVQETGQQYGFLVFRPFYREGVPTTTVAERRHALLGYNTAVFRVGEIMTRFVPQATTDRFAVQLFDRSAPDGEQLLFASGTAVDSVPTEKPATSTQSSGTQSSGTRSSGTRSSGTPTSDNPGAIAATPPKIAASWSYDIAVPGRTWQLRIDVPATHLFGELHHSGWGILIAGLMICALIGALTLISTGRQVELEQHVDERTKQLQEEISAREEAESNLLQSQSLNIVGQLTGGIAHDFNNLLGVIVASTELIDPHDEDGRESREAILDAASRGANLTQRLLAFSSRQVLHSQTIDPKELIYGMSGLFNRALGETVHVELRVPEEAWFALADPSQLENALLNLAVNARDAMPGGGSLIIECSNVTINAAYCARVPEASEGEFVAIAATDTGSGMTDAVLQHAFEPFFTTKEFGRGTGLGLSMIYGFAKQSGGHATIASELQQGTTVTLFLPRSVDALKPNGPRENALTTRGTGQTILVLEDDESLRTQVMKSLRKLGYNPIAAEDAQAARSRFAEHDVDLLLSDVVLPGGVSGPAFASEVRQKDSQVPIIFMSGYATESAKRDLPADVAFLNKPIRIDELAQAVRAALA